MQKIHGLVLFYLLFPAFAYGAKAGRCPVDFRRLVRSVEKERDRAPDVTHPRIFWQNESEISFSAKAKIVSVIHETDNLLAQFMPHPDRVNLTFAQKPGEAGAYPKFGPADSANVLIQFQQIIKGRAPSAPGAPLTSNAPELPPGQRWLTVHPGRSVATWIHEYTHAYFDKNFRFPFEELSRRVRKKISEDSVHRAGFDRLQTLQQRLLEIEDFHESVLTDLGPNPSPDELAVAMKLLEEDPTSREYERIPREMDEIEKKLAPEIAKAAHIEKNYFLITRAMEELFSDTVPGVQLNDIDALQKIFPKAGLIKKLVPLRNARGFTNRRDPNWKTENVHAALHATRIRIGQLAGPRIKTIQDKSDFLKTIFLSIQTELQFWAQEGDLTSFEPEEINRRLVAAIESRM